MNEVEFLEKLDFIQKVKCETNTLEIKAAKTNCPSRLYDTLSSFSNQDDGGCIVFGVDESDNFKEVGVYDAQDLCKKIKEQCLQMEPRVVPLLYVVEKNNKTFVLAQIPPIDKTLRPCFYIGKGKLKGSYVRICDSDEPMTDTEIFSYEAYRTKQQDDLRIIDSMSISDLDSSLLDKFLLRLKQVKPRLANLESEQIYKLSGMIKDNHVTLSSLMLFHPYPQSIFPMFCITAVVVPGTQVGNVADSGERFLDNKRIEGNILDMLEDALSFIYRNMSVRTIINKNTLKRDDKTDYPEIALREAILNALVHRDYSIHSQNKPIEILMFNDRIEIKNPGGVFGKISIAELGDEHPDTRNPILAGALEVLGVTENRYSGIPTIQKAMKEYSLQPAEFTDSRGTFTVCLRKQRVKAIKAKDESAFIKKQREIIEFCKTPKTRQQLVEFIGLSSASHAIKTYVKPLVDRGLIMLSIPDKPSSSKQIYTSVDH